MKNINIKFNKEEIYSIYYMIFKLIKNYVELLTDQLCNKGSLSTQEYLIDYLLRTYNDTKYYSYILENVNIVLSTENVPVIYLKNYYYGFEFNRINYTLKIKIYDKYHIKF